MGNPTGYAGQVMLVCIVWGIDCVGLKAGVVAGPGFEPGSMGPKPPMNGRVYGHANMHINRLLSPVNQHDFKYEWGDLHGP